MHRVMTTTVGGINSVTGLGTDIPDHLARRISQRAAPTSWAWT